MTRGNVKPLSYQSERVNEWVYGQASEWVRMLNPRVNKYTRERLIVHSVWIFDNRTKYRLKSSSNDKNTFQSKVIIINFRRFLLKSAREATNIIKLSHGDEAARQTRAMFCLGFSIYLSIDRTRKMNVKIQMKWKFEQRLWNWCPTISIGNGFSDRCNIAQLPNSASFKSVQFNSLNWIQCV